MNSQAPDSAHQRWLLEQLPALLANGVIDAAAAERLRRHYATVTATTARPWGLILSALLGTALTGAGLILLLAHNWETWGRTTRTIVSLLPLLLTQALTLYTLLRRTDSLAWRESSALAQLCAIAAGIALIGQTYHLPGDVGSFLLSCVLLSLPLVYLLDAAVVAVLCIGGITAWGVHDGGADSNPAGTLGLLALLLPYLALCLRRERYSRRSRGLLAGFALSLGMLSLAALDHHAWPLTLGALAAASLLADARWLRAAPAQTWRPLAQLGRFGIAAIALLLASGADSFESRFMLPSGSALEQAAQGLLGYGPLCASLILWALAWSRREVETLFYGALPLLCLLLQALALPGLTLAAFNLYTLGLGIVSIRRGLQQQDARAVNFGLLVIVLLGMIRFLATDLPYWLRGLAFVLAGAGFFAANLWLKRRATA